MSEPVLAGAADVADALQRVGYRVVAEDLAGEPGWLAETPYALVGCVELNDWDRLAERVFDVQAALTRVAGEAPSPITWDLYLIALVQVPARSVADRAAVEVIEGDTRYARKFVHAALGMEVLERALRPFLPLMDPVELMLGEPMEDLLEELIDLKVEEGIARAAVESFKAKDTVEIP
jgi:hypothetical protein